MSYGWHFIAEDSYVNCFGRGGGAKGASRRGCILLPPLQMLPCSVVIWAPEVWVVVEICWIVITILIRNKHACMSIQS